MSFVESVSVFKISLLNFSKACGTAGGVRAWLAAVLLIASFLVLQRPNGYSEAKPRCKGNPKIVGSCYSVHGRLIPGADTIELRLWPVGTHRMLGVSDGPAINDAEDPIYPKNIVFPTIGETIYGDFEVCPFTPQREGAMQFVCIESAAHLVVVKDKNSTAP